MSFIIVLGEDFGDISASQRRARVRRALRNPDMNIQTTPELPEDVYASLIRGLKQLKASLPGELIKSFHYKCVLRPPHLTADEMVKLSAMSEKDAAKFWEGRKPLSFEYAWENSSIKWTSQVTFERDELTHPNVSIACSSFKLHQIEPHWALLDLCIGLSGEVDLIAVEW